MKDDRVRLLIQRFVRIPRRQRVGKLVFAHVEKDDMAISVGSFLATFPRAIYNNNIIWTQFAKANQNIGSPNHLHKFSLKIINLVT